MRLFAWSNRETPDDLVAMAARFPGLGLVLKPQNYVAIERLNAPPIAYLTSLSQAEEVARLGKAGFRWHAAIVMDEGNQTGPSGAYRSPEQYAATFGSIAATLRRAGVPVSTMGLAPKRTWLWDTLRCRRFDDWYHARLPNADLRGFNPNGVRRRELERALRKGEKWILSPAPFRGAWDNFWSPIKVPGWAKYARDPRVHAIALWCLKEVQEGNGRWQTEHGLLDRSGNLTRVGTQVKHALT